MMFRDCSPSTFWRLDRTLAMGLRLDLVYCKFQTSLDYTTTSYLLSQRQKNKQEHVSEQKVITIEKIYLEKYL